MTSDLSDLLEQRGWHQSATLQRFKTFDFPPECNVVGFVLRLLNLDFSKEIHMQATPKKGDHKVEVYLSYEPRLEKEVKELLFAIENVYIGYLSEDS